MAYIAYHFAWQLTYYLVVFRYESRDPYTDQSHNVYINELEVHFLVLRSPQFTVINLASLLTYRLFGSLA